MNFSISVVIPNYNGKSLLAEILPDLFHCLSTTTAPYEVIIVDDRSNDESVEFIQQTYPEIIVIRNEENLGFSGTVNKGIYAAKMDLVLILNNDVKLIAPYFEPQLRFFQDPKTFGINATVLNWNSDILQGGGKLINRHLFKIKANQNYYVKADQALKNEPLLTMFLSGTNALIDRKKLLDLGGYDELLSPFYVEDVELSLRALRMGWKMYYVPGAACMHQVSTTIKKHSKKRKIKLLTLRNKFYVHYIHLQGLSLTMWWIQTVVEVLLRTLALNLIYWRALVLIIRNLKKASASKQRFQEMLKYSEPKNQGLFSALKIYRQELLKKLN
ncbi:glycosyltransferase family 2 protein [Pedobacter deserti]|uniref:glycosyltransferase family 2 protein n=1 Tax=Pedobacter deserti TaxID=2817382 RepID=UPI0021095067|nr:glycosyltransferase family 2 protein [Pedobacter sp. SYSU D00382]